MDRLRRNLMLGAASTTLTLGLPLGAKAAVLSLDDFIRISAQLCQRPADSLDRNMAQRILQALDTQGKSPGLLALAQQADADPVLAAELRAIWFSGMINTPSGNTLLGFQEVLAWNSAPFLHVPGSCGGPTGYWSEAPGINP